MTYWRTLLLLVLVAKGTVLVYTEGVDGDESAFEILDAEFEWRMVKKGMEFGLPLRQQVGDVRETGYELRVGRKRFDAGFPSSIPTSSANAVSASPSGSHGRSDQPRESAVRSARP